jgi:hypothetical protein
VIRTELWRGLDRVLVEEELLKPTVQRMRARVEVQEVGRRPEHRGLSRRSLNFLLDAMEAIGVF